MLKTLKRHQLPCKRSRLDQRPCLGKGADCPILIRGTLNGKRIQLSTAKFLGPEQARSLAAARDLAMLWERVGRPVRPGDDQESEKEPPAPAATSVPTVAQAVDAYLAEASARANAEATIYKKRIIFERQLLAFCQEKGIRFLYELDVNLVREWRSTWKDEPLARRKKQGRVLGFFWFCERCGWVPLNTAHGLTNALGKIQVRESDTGYFTPEQYAKILDTTHIYSDRPLVHKHDSVHLGSERIRALTELMRWTGLRIRDAVTLERSRLHFDSVAQMWQISLRQRKTGDPVYCPIPPHLAAMLKSVPPGPKVDANERYFFWTGNGLAKTVVANWQRSYRKLFALADVEGHPHMFRDTFAVEALLSGVSVKDVSILLGHTSITTTEKHYMPWVRARQTNLNQSVVSSWVKQGVVPDSKPQIVRMARRGA